MKAIAFIVALLIALPALAEENPVAKEVVCGEEWVSFVPYAYASLERSPVLFLIRKSNIEQGSLLFRVGIGFLRVKKGYGWGPTEDELKVPEETYLLIARCLTGEGPGSP